MLKVNIREGTIEDVLRISNKIPEFNQEYGITEYEKRLNNSRHLILIADVAGKLAGFKVGYTERQYFYSWMGGVIPGFRRNHVATLLAESQEAWVKQQEIKRIRFKTQNRFKSMLIFAIKNGFSIIGTVPYEGGEGFKILLEKKLP